MSTTTFNLRSYVNGLPVDLTSIEFQNSGNTYGARRTDTNGVVIASGTDWTRLAVGVYQHILTDPTDDLIYEYTIRIVVPGETNPRYYNRTIESATTVNHVYSIPNSDYYSSEAEVMRFMGEMATSLMTEDWDADDKSPVWNDLLAYVDETIDMTLGQKYDRAAIINNAYVRRRATILVAHHLSQRRANPPVFKMMADQILDEFKDVQTGVFFIPNATPFARNAPVVRNYMMQPHFRHPQRVITTKSTGGSYSGMDPAYEPFMYSW